VAKDRVEADSKNKPKPAGGKPESVAWKVYAGVTAVLAGTITRKVVEKLWLKTTGKPPPDQPESPSVHWSEAVGWAAVSGTSVAVARLLATRKAAGAWKRSSGEDAPV
jgi:Protein of unknown function (DUF4235)